MAQPPIDPNQLTTPLANIALTFSGGGFRAASFSLGALSYLHHLTIQAANNPGTEERLLKHVSYISSTSGGSFTNALYSAYIHQGKTFEDVYKKLMTEIAGQKLLEEVFAIMEDDTQWNQPGNDKNKNFINAFAKAYDKILYQGETFGIFWNKQFVHNFEVCFNTTDFYRGLSFRFQTEGTDNPKQIVGNNYLHIDTQELATLKKIKLADMVASSSCFPAGFEPIVYPQDFSYAKDEKKLSIAELQKAMLYENYQEVEKPITSSYGFMDGGITDNQGLYSAMLADKKRRNRKEPHPFDLIMITDVASYFMDEYKIPVAQTTPTWRSHTINFFKATIAGMVNKFAGITKWGLIISLLLLIAGIVTIILAEQTAIKIAAGIVCGASGIISLCIIILNSVSPVKWVLKNKAKLQGDVLFNEIATNQNFFSEKIMIRLIRFLRFAKIGQLEQMVKARVASMLSMVLDINLKQTRRLIYEMFYNDPVWNNRRIPNFIYELSEYNVTSRTNRFNSEFRLKWKATEDDKALLLGNCSQLNAIAEDARNMGTTMWFDESDTKDQRLKKLVATGQFTTCCNLLEYLISLERKGVSFEDNINNQLVALKAKLVTDFTHFKTDPYFLYDEMGE